MCGVAGIFNYADSARPIDAELLRCMSARISHRGPDGEHYFINGPLGLAHRRLSIVDISPSGAQPMQSADGTACISYNGEIYDHQRVRANLESLGYTFRSSSDTATLLALLQHAGPDALSTLSGIFAFAYWDARAHRLLLARDAMGVKQMYYHDDGSRIIFASEIKALLVCPDVRPALDAAVLNEYIHFHTPLVDRTFFHGIKQLRPAEYIDIGAAGLSHKNYWRIPAAERVSGISTADCVDQLKELLQEVVRDQTMADVPLGVFLSGGVDSSVVAALARQSVSKLECYGVHFDHPDVVDERPFQEQVAKHLGLPLHLTSVNHQNFPDDFMRLMYFQDQPVVGSTMLPMYYLNRLASQGVKVCLGGQGADELFGGYARYSLAHPASAALDLAYNSTVGRLKSRGVGSERGTQGALVKQLNKRNLRRLSQSICQPSASHRYFSNFVPVRDNLWRSLTGDAPWLSRRNAHKQFSKSIQRSPFDDVGDRLLHWDARGYLPGLFQQEDRMSMANGLEARVPFADRRLVEFAFGLPFNLKVRGGSTKWLLRRVASEWVPPCVLTRRKVGFDSPVESWLKHEHHSFLRDILLDSKAVSRALWDPRILSNLIDDINHPAWFDVMWKVLCVEGWARNFLISPVSRMG